MDTAWFQLLTVAAISGTLAATAPAKDEPSAMNDSFATGGGIKAWATKSFFGGSRTYEFSRSGIDLVIVSGMPTSGMLTNQVIVFGRTKPQSTYRRLVSTSVFYAQVTVKEDSRGVVLSVKDKVILIVPFEIAAFGSTAGPSSPSTK